MSDFIDDQIIFSNLIKEVGSTCIYNGKTISDILTIEGVSLWEVSSPEMAWRHLVNIAEAKKLSEKLKVYLRPKLYKGKLISDLMYKSFEKTTFQIKSNSDYIMSLGFSPQMYNDVVDPVVKNLIHEFNFEHSLVCQADNEKSFKNNNYNMIQFGMSKIENFNKKKKDYFNFLKKTEQMIKESESYKKLILMYKMKFNSDILEKLFELFFNGLAPINLINLIYARFYLEKILPKCIISPDIADARCRVFVLTAKTLNIPVYEIQFGLTGPEGIEWRFFNSDRVAVWGEQAKKHLISHGIPSSKISVTGSARHDLLVYQARKKNDGVKHNLRKNITRILFASTYTDIAHSKYCPPEKIVEMKKAVINSVINNNQFYLTIKPHPKENEADLKKIVGVYGNNISIAEKHKDIRNLILECDAFVSFGSTASLDALLAGKKTGSLVFPGWSFSNELLGQTPITMLDTVEKVNSFIRTTIMGTKINYDSKESNQIKQMCIFDGKATKRISKDIIDLLQVKR